MAGDQVNYLSTDPNAGEETPKYLSTDPNAGGDPLKTGEGMLPGEGGPIAKPATDPVLKAYSDTLDPQERYLDRLPAGQREAAAQRMGKGTGMWMPTALASVGTMSPIANIAEKGLLPGIKEIGSSLLRTGLKSAAGSEIGGYGGRKLGQAIDGEEGGRVGQQIGETGGAMAGPFVPNGVYARMPLGMGRMFLSDADYATARAGSKVAQRAADIRAGLRKPPVVAAPMPDNATLSTRGGTSLVPVTPVTPSPSDLTTTGAIHPQFVREIPKTQPPSIAGPEVEGPIGSNSSEREIQTLMQKGVLTPDQQAKVERFLGPNARMKPGEGLAAWRSRVTGMFKASRPRTE